jgi:hypothetical protein
MRKLRFIECSDGTKAHVGDTVSITYAGETWTGVIDTIYSDLRYFSVRSGDEIRHGFASSRVTIKLVERKKK